MKTFKNFSIVYAIINTVITMLIYFLASCLGIGDYVMYGLIILILSVNRYEIYEIKKNL